MIKKNNSLKTSTLDSFNYSFQDTGIYSYSFVVYNTLGCYDSIYKEDTIQIIKPKVQISISDSTPCMGEKVTFDASHIDELIGLVHYWNFTNKTYSDPLNNTGLLADSGDVIFKHPGVYDYDYIYYARIGPKCKDTFTGKGIIKVSGTDLDVITSNDDDCIPLVTDLSSSVVRTQNHKNLFPSFSYQWKASDTSIKFTTPLNASTKATMSERGKKYVSLVYRDKSGCKDSTPLLPHYVGVLADFNTTPQACLNGLTRMTNVSALNPTNYKWIVNDPSITIIPNDTSKNVDLKFTALGRFTVTLVASKNGCSDTFKRNVTSVSIKAKFYSPQPVNQCAPVIVEFIDSSNNPNITKRYWDFGDGSFAQTGLITRSSHAYLNNTDTAGINIKLIVQNNYGCADTLEKIGYVKVLGPIPSLRLIILRDVNH